jgi:hypothetical protein
VLAAATALLSAALAGVGGTAVALQASGRTESSALAFAAGGAPTRALAALDVLPRLALTLDRRTLRLALAYEPQLRVSQVLSYAAGEAALAQGGAAQLAWDVHPLWRATASARASVRILDFVAPGGAELARLLDLRRAPASLRLREDAATLAIEGRPAPLLTVSAALSADASGGAGASGAAALPGMREARAAASVARAQTPIDTVRLELSGAAAAFDVGGSASLATASLGWARQATRTLRLHLSAAASRTRDAGGAARLVPGGEAGLEASPLLGGRPVAVAAALRAGPVFDRYAAAVQQRAGLDASAMWAVAPRWRVGGAAAAGRVLDRLGYGAWRGDLRAEWKTTPRVTLYGDVWQERHRDPRGGALGTATYAGASLGAIVAPAVR